MEMELRHKKLKREEAYKYAAFSMTTTTTTSMRMEVKLRIQDCVAHWRLNKLLSEFHYETQHQENFFFDGANNELSSHQIVLFLRFYSNEDPHCFLAIKAGAVLDEGVCKVDEEEEEDIEPAVGRACVAQPEKLWSVECGILKRLKEKFGVLNFVRVGGFVNVREKYKWKDLKLEVDKTLHEFGTNHELECETSDPEGVKKKLEEFLKENKIQYSYSQASKFEVFRSKKLPQLVN